MNGDVYIIGASCTPFGRALDTSFKSFTRTAFLDAVRDSGLDDGLDVEGVWFGSSLMGHWGQHLTRGNVCFAPLVQEGLLPAHAPIVNVEAGCATGSVALLSAAKEIASGCADVTAAVGVEKLYDPESPEQVLWMLGTGMDVLDEQENLAHYRRIADEVGQRFTPHPSRGIGMDVYALQAQIHAARFGTTPEQIAVGAAKNHTNAVSNPRAQYRFAMTAQQVLDDRMVVRPLTRSMCAPIGDGASGAILCSERFLRSAPSHVRDRAVRIRGFGVAGGRHRRFDEPSLSHVAARRAYRAADLVPGQIDVAEVHDATSFSEIYQCEMLGFCDIGHGGGFVAGGATAVGGTIPINTSGGLVSKGHPVGATGLSMCFELVTQLRNEAGPRQVPHADRALQENGGGMIGLDEAVVAVIIYQRARAAGRKD